jgi:anti-anti-sigma factor
VSGKDNPFAAFNSLDVGVNLEQSTGAGEESITVSVRGHIETGNAARFQDAVLDFIKARSGLLRLRLDISQVSYVSSMGIGALATVHKQMAERKGSLLLCRASPRLKELFGQLGFADIFEMAAEGCPEGEAAFPLTISCPGCRTSLRVSKAGRFRCQSCGVVFTVDASGNAAG